MDWTNLKHAYGDAEDLPALLAGLSPESPWSVWDELWSRLCHQGTVYSASFAALPGLLDAAERWKPAERAQLIVLAASILASEDVSGGCADIVRQVEWVAPRFQQLCRESLTQAGLSKRDFIYLLQAARSFEGDRFWGEHLNYLDSGEFPGECPHCGVDLYLVIGESGFFTTAEEWIQRRASPHVGDPIMIREDVKRSLIEPNNGVLPEDGQWLYEHAQAAQQDEVARWIRHVFGTSVCPKCGHNFPVKVAIAVD